MRRSLAILAVGAVLALGGPLGGCATPGQPTPAVALTPAQAAKRAMLAAEAAFNVAATAELDAKALGLLKGKKAVKADATRHQAYASLLALRSAYAAGQQPDLANLLALTNQLLVLAGKPPATPET